ncbi:MAG: DUF4037 domain-containing protein [Clostridiales bacterium]|nr:DUF4037 domain-containing protein [Clostridiales bacterium]
MWNGLKISEMFFEEYGMPMLTERFEPYLGEIAAGLVGQGSECFGYDDRISRDHDFAPGFCLWIPETLRGEIGDELQKAYDSLPADKFILRHRIDVGMAPDESFMTGARKERIGVHSIEEFYFERTGMTGAPETAEDWLKTPQMYLSEAVNGKVFYDPSGKFSAIRSVWQGHYPENILKKKLAADCGMAGKTGQFNYERCLRRGDTDAAYYCVTEFIRKATAALFLLNRKYMPYYKWIGRAMADFEKGKDAVPLLSRLSQLPESEKLQKTDLIEKISAVIIKEIRDLGWSDSYSDYLLDQGKAIMKTITDSEIASWNVFVGED